MRFASLLIAHTCMTTQKSFTWSSITCCLYEKMMICQYFIKKSNIYRVSNQENKLLILFTSYTISEMFYGYSRTIIDANKWYLQKNLSVKRHQLLTFFSQMHLASRLSHIFSIFLSSVLQVRRSCVLLRWNTKITMPTFLSLSLSFDKKCHDVKTVTHNCDDL